MHWAGRARARLTADADDASITPLNAINNSIGEQTAMLSSWQVHPHNSGEVILVAHIQFPLSNTSMRDQTVSLRIHVDDKLRHIFLSIIGNFWTQVVAVTSVLGTATKFVWNWYRRRGESRSAPNGNASREEAGAKPSGPATLSCGGRLSGGRSAAARSRLRGLNSVRR